MVLARASRRYTSEFGEQELCNTAWALATVNQRHEELFDMLATVVKWRLEETEKYELSNTACASVVVEQSGEKLFSLQTRAADPGLGELRLTVAWSIVARRRVGEFTE
eukprot:gnl/TRDRNA2_/TRDRNA2_154109_c2_seq5.p2 gnl/TRDRNA2_/TRDRNA2_154109_c2~~gnl/TRDRNA2_/TRDRNA2_154109_c2_seq5.p2  ORF type:complete len:108 (+),score=23.52 gnl/TRDRNA2_/TRDRNA2_154109_c2_seq5:46-369(+)